MTGIMVRVERGGRWQDLELDELTDDESNAWAAERVWADPTPPAGWRWAIRLARWIRDHARDREPATITSRQYREIKGRLRDRVREWNGRTRSWKACSGDDEIPGA